MMNEPETAVLSELCSTASVAIGIEASTKTAVSGSQPASDALVNARARTEARMATMSRTVLDRGLSIEPALPP